MKRSVVLDQLYLNGYGSIYFDHNTVILDSIRDSAINIGMDSRGPSPENYHFVNNVIVSMIQQRRLLHRLSRGIPLFEYNCIYGFDSSGSRRPVAIEALGESNLITDPLLDRTGAVPVLTENSPCIDTGDPEAPRDPDGTRSDIGARYFHHEVSVIADQPSAFDFRLSAFPNPFNSSTKITFSLAPGFGEAGLRIYDLSGRLGADLLDRQGRLSYGKEGKITPPTPLASRGGKQSVVWDASGQAAGLYFCKVVAGGNTATTKVMLVK